MSKKKVIKVEANPVSTDIVVRDLKKELEQLSVPEAIALKLNEYRSMTVKDMNDHTGFKAIRKARIEMRDARVAITKEAKAIRQSALDFQKEVIRKEDELIAPISEVEELLAKQEEFYQSENDKYRAELDRQKNERITNRVGLLSQFMYFNGISYSYKSYVIDMLTIEQGSDEYFNKFLNDAKTEFEADTAEQERIDSVIAARTFEIVSLGMLFDASVNVYVTPKGTASMSMDILHPDKTSTDEFKVSVDALKDSIQAEIKQQQDYERLQKEQDDARKLLEQLRETRLKSRQSQLATLKFVYDGANYRYEKLLAIGASDVASLSDEDFQLKIDDYRDKIEEHEKLKADAAETRRQDELLAAKTKALEDARKAEEAAKLLETQRKIEEERLAALAPDKEKINTIIVQLKAINYPAVKSPQANKLINAIKHLVTKIEFYVNEEITKL